MPAGGDRKPTDSANRERCPGLTLTTIDSRKWRQDGLIDSRLILTARTVVRCQILVRDSQQSGQ